MKKIGYLLVLLCFIAITDVQAQKSATLFYNGTIYTVDSSFSIAEAMVIQKGKVLGVGSKDDMLKHFKPTAEVNLQGKYVYPGLIDAHSHFLGLGEYMTKADLTGTQSFDEVMQRVQEFQKQHPTDSWIIGRGWDQNDWEEKTYPTKDRLDELFPDQAVLLKRVDGHAALVNQKALDLANITVETEIDGGMIVKKEGRVTGVLVDNAVDLVANVVPKPNAKQIKTFALNAQRECVRHGLTTVCDAGLDKDKVLTLQKLYREAEFSEEEALKLRLYVMLNPTEENFETFKGPLKTERLNVSSFKIYADGALGSRGAYLSHPYHDVPNQRGFLLQSKAYYQDIVKRLAASPFQMNTHCIGDEASHFLLQLYGDALGENNDRRWRIEHAQVMKPEAFELYRKYSVIPSVQPTHATSDMYWADERLGEERLKYAYAFKELLELNGFLPLGTDFPVEAVSPFYTFYAAVARQDAKGYPEGGFQMENALTREQALRGITIWAAYAGFEEQEKGSLEAGKFADFVILDRDLMKVPIVETRNPKVLATYINGERVYKGE